MKTQNVVVDIGNLKASDIFFVQGEQGREITFKVINSLLEDFVNLAGYTATIHILKSDGNFTIDTMTIDSAKCECYYTLTENDCACGGRGFYDLSFSKNDELIYTAHGDFVGDFRSVNDDSVASVSTVYGVTFPEGFQMKLTAGDNITILNNVISAIVREYHEGTGIDIENDFISISENVLNAITGKQDKLTAGEGIALSENNVISATGGTYRATLLYSTNAPSLSPVTLSDSWKNYDALYIEGMFNGNAYFGNIKPRETIQKAANNNLYVGFVSFASAYIGLMPVSNDGISLAFYGENTNGVSAIYGIKY